MDQDSAQGAGEAASLIEGQEISAKDVLQQGTIETSTSEEQSAEEIAAAGEKKEEEKKVEEKPEEKKEESSQEKLFSAKFAALSRKEKALKKRERELEMKMAELEKKITPAAAETKQQEPLELRLKKDPFNTLKELGIGYDVLTNIALNDGKLTPELQMQLLKQELSEAHEKKLRELEEKITRKEEEELKKAHEERVENFKLGIDNFVKANAAEYELLSVEGEDGVQLVFDVMDTHYKETEEVLDLKTAAELVENYLLEEAKKRVGLSKVKKLLGASEEKAQIQNKPEQKKQSVTLTNSQSQSATTGRRGMSQEEQLMEAAKMIRWNAE